MVDDCRGGRPHAAAVCAYITGHRPLALPLGELSPQVTERAGMVMVCPLRPRCARPPLPEGEAREAHTAHQNVCRGGALSRPEMTIPPSARSADTSATLRRTTQCEHWAAFTQGRLDAAALPRHTGRCGHRPLRTSNEGAAGQRLSLRRFAPPPSQREARMFRITKSEGRTPRFLLHIFAMHRSSPGGCGPRSC